MNSLVHNNKAIELQRQLKLCIENILYVMRKIFIIIFIILLYPLLINIWHGVLKSPISSTIHQVNCQQLSNDVSGDISNIISTIESHGNKLDSKNNYGSAEGYKAIRSVFKHRLPLVCKKIDKRVEDLIEQCCKATGKKLFKADCKNEKYCWFVRLYNKNNHFLDWHFDNNFTKGLRYTMVNTLFITECNTSHFMVKDNNNRIRTEQSKQGTGVVYNGSDIKHAISTQTNDCIRIVLVVPLYETLNKSLIGQYRQFVRNITDSVLTL